MLEVCIDNLDSAKNAIEGGADRLELCADLFSGGLTPELSLLHEIRSFSNIPIHVMIRSRAGDFCYSNAEMKLMLQQVDLFDTEAIEGFVFGALTEELKVNVHQLKQIQEAVGDKKLVFHRAIDESVDLTESIKVLIDNGVEEVLTSGGEATVPEAQELMKTLHAEFGNRIALLAGSGLTVHNVGTFIEASGLKRIHGSFSKNITDPDNGKIKLTSTQDVKTAKHILQSFIA